MQLLIAHLVIDHVKRMAMLSEIKPQTVQNIKGSTTLGVLATQTQLILYVGLEFCSKPCSPSETALLKGVS